MFVKKKCMEIFIEEIKDISAELGIANRRRKILAIANHRVNQHYAPLGGQDLLPVKWQVLWVKFRK